jgi:AraC-like DNA-binding protein
MIHYKSIIQVPYGTPSKIAKDIGCNNRYVARALRYDSLTAPSQIKIRQLAMEKYGGREVRITIK